MLHDTPPNIRKMSWVLDGSIIVLGIPLYMLSETTQPFPKIQVTWTITNSCACKYKLKVARNQWTASCFEEATTKLFMIQWPQPLQRQQPQQGLEECTIQTLSRWQRPIKSTLNSPKHSWEANSTINNVQLIFKVSFLKREEMEHGTSWIPNFSWQKSQPWLKFKIPML